MRQRARWVVLVMSGMALVFGLAGCEFLEEFLGLGGATDFSWTTDESIQVASQSIGSTGGSITVHDPGGPIDGMTIDVPSGAMTGSTRFDVSYTPITGSIGPNIDPLTPLITVDNGGAFAGGVMTVTIPVAIPADHFAMGFLVDDSGDLEGMPLVSSSSTSITMATAHFSRFFVSSVSTAALNGTIDSGFRPMSDDWQFPNYGSYIAPGGHCAGQSLTAMWYYVERAQKGTSSLYGRFDNNGDLPASPDFYLDDSLGYRLASVVQHDIDWDNWLREVIKVLGTSDDPLNWQAFLYAMLVTGEPQYVAIYGATGGHAMIVYKADASAGTLYVADPNYPGDSSRVIRYSSGSFSPYNSGASKAAIDAGQGTAYPEIRYFAKSALVDWGTLETHWEAFDAGTIGDGVFPDYELSVGDPGSAVPLTDGASFSSDSIEVTLSDGEPAVSSSYAVRRNDEWLSFDSNGHIPLETGKNRLGFYMVSEAGGSDAYGDFQWLTVHKTGAGYVTISVQVHGYWEHVNSGEVSTDDSAWESNAFNAYAGRTMTDGLFHAEWYQLTLPGGEGPYTGGMNVQFNDDMSEIEWFYASESQSIGGASDVWSAGGMNIPRARIGNGFHEYIVDGAACCTHLDVFSHQIDHANGDTSTLTHYTCDGSSRIQIHWYERAPDWLTGG